MFKLVKQQVKIFLQRFFCFVARDFDATKETGPTLVLAPHPDDETLGCGATIARLKKLGRKVRVVIVTDGAIPAAKDPQGIAKIRKVEVTKACELLGVTAADLGFLDFPDEQADRMPDQLEAKLAEEVRSFQPKQIFSPYGVDGHSDHRAIAEAVDRLCTKGVITCPVYEYPIWFWSRGAVQHLLTPHKLLKLVRMPVGEYLGVKKAAVNAHESQHRMKVGEYERFTFPSGFLGLFYGPYEVFFVKSNVKH